MYEKNELKKKAVVMMDGGRWLSLNLYLRGVRQTLTEPGEHH